MEVVARLRHISDLHIAILVLAIKLVRRREDARVLVAKLEISLHSSRRVLWALAVVSVRQGHDKTSTLKPFHFTGSDELIDDTLRVVREVTELSFPHD
jgi:hypothetical protein